MSKFLYPIRLVMTAARIPVRQERLGRSTGPWASFRRFVYPGACRSAAPRAELDPRGGLGDRDCRDLALRLPVARRGLLVSSFERGYVNQ